MTRCVKIGNATLYEGDCFDILPRIGAGTVKVIAMDPPYNIKIDAFDGPIDFEQLCRLSEILLADDSFFSFYTQMPIMVDWAAAARERFGFVDDISWVKRNVTAIAQPLCREHEHLLIYRKGRPRYNQTKGSYSDVKVQRLYAMPEYIKSVKRQISHLHSEIKTGKKSLGGKGKRYQAHNYMDIPSLRAPETVNYTNVWSFLPQNVANRKEGRIDHATVKPVAMVERLVRLLAHPGDMVLDPFLGSGTTGVACATLGQPFIGMEKDPRYFDMACERIEAAHRAYLSKPSDLLDDRTAGGASPLGGAVRPEVPSCADVREPPATARAETRQAQCDGPGDAA